MQHAVAVGGRCGRSRTAAPGPRGVHLMTNEIIEVNGDRATAWSKWTYMIRTADNKPVPRLEGHYDDSSCVRTVEWKFLKRRTVWGDIPYSEPPREWPNGVNRTSRRKCGAHPPHPFTAAPTRRRAGYHAAPISQHASRRCQTIMIIDCHGHYTTAPKATAEVSRRPDRRAQGSGRGAAEGDAQHQRRPDPREPRGRAAQVPARARHRRHDLLAARVGDGASHRRRDDQPALDAALQRPDPSRLRRSIPRTSSACASCRSRRACRRPTASRSSSAASTSSGFIGCNLNPDPSGGHWTAPPLTDKHWYPFYEKMVELDVPAMVHVSASCNPNFHATGAHYINADTTAFMQFLTARSVQGLPDAAIHHPARRRRGAVSLGPLSRARAGHEAAAARRT